VHQTFTASIGFVPVHETIPKLKVCFCFTLHITLM